MPFVKITILYVEKIRHIPLIFQGAKIQFFISRTMAGKTRTRFLGETSLPCNRQCRSSLPRSPGADGSTDGHPAMGSDLYHCETIARKTLNHCRERGVSWLFPALSACPAGKMRFGQWISSLALGLQRVERSRYLWRPPACVGDAVAAAVCSFAGFHPVEIGDTGCCSGVIEENT